MTRIGPLRTSATWKYALIGGLAGLFIDLGSYLQAGTGDEFSLNGALLGGALAGYLAAASGIDTDAGSAGVRAGLIGGLPAFGILVSVFDATSALAGPLWFQVVALGVIVGTILLTVLGFAALLGAIGAKFGAWIAERWGGEAAPAVGT